MTAMRAILPLICLLVGLHGAAVCPVDSLLQRIDSSYGEPAAGVWSLTASPDALLAFCPSNAVEGRLDIWLIDSPDFNVEPCTLIGHAVAGTKPGSYDLTLDEHPGNPKARKRSFIATIDDTGMNLQLHAYHRGKRISLWRWIPYLYRVSVIENSNRPDDHDGLRRVYPADGGGFCL